ncbi:uncharacterized protein [Diadema antillarum]|uniref:uncharacterized protein n=1 Tax=Diadema antillarum TaxID=105358 RepID=UPI003A88F1F3
MDESEEGEGAGKETSLECEDVTDEEEEKGRGGKNDPPIIGDECVELDKASDGQGSTPADQNKASDNVDNECDVAPEQCSETGNDEEDSGGRDVNEPSGSGQGCREEQSGLTSAADVEPQQEAGEEKMEQEGKDADVPPEQSHDRGGIVPEEEMRDAEPAPEEAQAREREDSERMEDAPAQNPPQDEPSVDRIALPDVTTLDGARQRISELKEQLEGEKTLRQDLEKANSALTQQVGKLHQEVHNLRRAGMVAVETQEIGIQTEPECIHIQDEQASNQAEVYQVGESSNASNQPSSSSGTRDWAARGSAQGHSSSSTSRSIADSVRATAEAALAHSGVVLDEASGMYYDYNSGYYYDPNNHLYYDPARGIYYYYDEQSQSYQFHSRVEMPEVVVGRSGAQRNHVGSGGRRDRDRHRGERSRRKNRDQNREDHSATNERQSTSADATCEVIDITSPTEDYPENGNDVGSQPQEGEERGDGHDVVEIVDEEDPARHRRRRRRKSSSSRKRKKVAGEEERRADGEELPDVIVLDSDESEMEEGELSESSSESRSSSRMDSGEDGEEGWSDDSEESMVIGDDEDDVQSVEATKVDYPPCIRMIVVRSESMKLGSLAVVTCTGGSIGREGSNHILLVPELGVSKTHAQIAYDKEKGFYTITDLGSQNGTVLNGVPLTQKSRVKSDPQPLSHKDYLTFGTTTLRIHIHRGSETCDECEPGQVQAMIRQQQSLEATSAGLGDKEQQRRRELRKLKKKYMLAGGGGTRDHHRTNAEYKDRAEERRVTVGSDNPYQPDDLPASVNRAISDTNMGHKMLKKMGWKEGDSLGTGDSGIKEPIQVFLHGKKAGLGAGGLKSMDSMEVLGRRNSENWDLARDRFRQLDQGTSRQVGRPQPMRWVKGRIQSADDQQKNNEDGPRKDGEMPIEVASTDGAGAHPQRNARENSDGTVSGKNDEIFEKDRGCTAESSVKQGSASDKSETLQGPILVVPSVASVSKDEVSSAQARVANMEGGDVASTSGQMAGDEQMQASQRKDHDVSKPACGQGPVLAGDGQSSSDHQGKVQNLVEAPVEREAAKKPIKFVIPPRLSPKPGGGKTPLTASAPPAPHPVPSPESNGEGPSTRRTRQSRRRTKDRTDKIDMFENG